MNINSFILSLKTLLVKLTETHNLSHDSHIIVLKKKCEISYGLKIISKGNGVGFFAQAKLTICLDINLLKKIKNKKLCALITISLKHVMNLSV